MMAADKTVAPDRPELDWPVIFVLAIVHVGALAALLPGAFSWPAIGVAIFLHWLTGGIGITLGYHRLITHRSFEIPKWLEYALLFCGMLACQKPLEWVAKHRMHHEHADAAGDPYDRHGSFWWTHLGWVLHRLPCDRDIPRYTKDIARDPVYHSSTAQFCSGRWRSLACFSAWAAGLSWCGVSDRMGLQMSGCRGGDHGTSCWFGCVAERGFDLRRRGGAVADEGKVAAAPALIVLCVERFGAVGRQHGPNPVPRLSLASSKQIE